MKEKCALCSMLTYNEHPDYDIPLCEPCQGKYPNEKRLKEALEDKGFDLDKREGLPEDEEFTYTSKNGSITFQDKEQAINFINGLMDCYDIERLELGW